MCFCILTLLTLDALCRALSITLLSVLLQPPHSELWLVLSLICTLLTSNMTWSTSRPARCISVGLEESGKECVRKRGENSPPSPTNPPFKKKHTHKSVCCTLGLPRVPHCRIWDRLCFHFLNMQSKALISGRETTLNIASVFSVSFSLSIFPAHFNWMLYWLQCQTEKKEILPKSVHLSPSLSPYYATRVFPVRSCFVS